jgi:hypothetical protein
LLAEARALAKVLEQPAASANSAAGRDGGKADAAADSKKSAPRKRR